MMMIKMMTLMLVLLASLSYHSVDGSSSCCPEKSDSLLRSESAAKVKQSLDLITLPLKNLLLDSLKLFTDEYHKLISSSRNTTTVMIAQNYHQLWETKRNATNNLFQSFSTYIFTEDKGNIESAVNKFFNQLYDEIYSRTFRSKSHNVNFIACVRERSRDTSSYFGLVPGKMISQLRKSLEVARTTINSIQLGINVLNVTLSTPLTDSCQHSLVKLFSCPLCRQAQSNGDNSALLAGVSPVTSSSKTVNHCTGYCVNVARGCLAHLTELDQPWSQFVTALESLSIGMIKDYNLQNVLEDIHLKIQEAIQTALDNTRKVNIACSGSSRRTRQADVDISTKSPQKGSNSLTLSSLVASSSSSSTVSPSSSSLSFNKSNNSSLLAILKYQRNRRHTAKSSLFVSLEDFVHRLSESNKFFHNLSDQLCGNRFENSQSCWNGHSFTGYTKPIVESGLKGQKSNPEVDPSPLPSSISNVIEKLKVMKETVHSRIKTIPESDSYRRSEIGSGDADDRFFDDEDYLITDGSGDGEASGDGDLPDDGSMGLPGGEPDIRFDDSNDVAQRTKKSKSHAVPLKGQPFIMLLVSLTLLFGSR